MNISSHRIVPVILLLLTFHTRAVWKVHGLVAVCCCYPEGGSDCYAKL